MKRIIITILAISVSIILNAETKSQEIKRFVIAVGANYGGNDRVRLKYAVSDASSFIDVFKELGGTEHASCFPLFNPDSRIFYSTFNQVKESITDANNKYRKTELFFYYSGHSDETGILLGDNKVFYADIKKILQQIPADVKITILDSCSSGAFTQAKGGQMKPSFMFDSSYDMKGNAVMTSSARDEVSQESDKIRSSFFTYYLLTGLRGAADVTQDKKISLNEAYQFAFNQTLQRTQKSIGGAQHPNYNIQMVGTGDVILTDISKGANQIVFDKKMQGKIYIHDENDVFIAEIDKSLGSETFLSLNDGTYKIINESDNNIFETSVEIEKNNTLAMNNDSFTKTNPEETTFRGEQAVDNPEIKRPMSKTVFSSMNMTFSGYGAPVQTVAFADKRVMTYSGAKGGVLINNKLCFGFLGMGLTSPIDRTEYQNNYSSEYPDYDLISLGFGGFMTEYYFFPEEIINFSFGLMTGAGSVTVTNDNQDSSTEMEDLAKPFFILYPEASMYIKVTRWFRIGASVGIILPLGVDNFGMNNSSIRSVTGSVVFAFGWF